MAEFDRAFLEGVGVPEAAVEAVLEAHEAALQAAVEGRLSAEEVERRVAEAIEGMVPEEEVGRRVDEAVSAALAGVDGEAVARLTAERDMLRAISGPAFENVKPKFREQVYALLDHSGRAQPIEAQLEAIRERYEECFIDDERGPRQPRFGGPTRGSMPRGAIGAAEQFSQAWGFGPRRNGQH